MKKVSKILDEAVNKGTALDSVEKRVYMMRPDLMKKYYSHNN